MSITYFVISKGTEYINSLYNQTTGFGSLIADLINPLASYQFHGATTFKPGTLLYQAANHCECCAAYPSDGPFNPLNKICQFKSPADMNLPFAAELINWSIAWIAQFQVINHQIGFNP